MGNFCSKKCRGSTPSNAGSDLYLPSKKQNRFNSSSSAPAGRKRREARRGPPKHSPPQNRRGHRFDSTAGKKPRTTGKQPNTTGKKPNTRGPKPNTNGQRISIPGQKLSTPGKEPSTPGKEPSTPGKEPSTPGKEPSTRGKEPSTRGKGPSTRGKESSRRGKKPCKRLSPKKEDDHQSGSLLSLVSIISSTITPPMENDSNDVIKFIEEKVGIDRRVVEVVVQLLNKNYTIPFIARYRRAQTYRTDADQLRMIKEAYEKSKKIKQKAEIVIKSIQKLGKLTPEIENAVRSSRSLDELKQFQMLYEKNSKSFDAGTMSEVGVHLAIAQAIIEGTRIENFRSYLDSKKEGLQSEAEIKNGVVSTLADFIVRNKRVIEMTKKLRRNTLLQIVTEKLNVTDTNDDNSDIEGSIKNEYDKSADKYEAYYDWSAFEGNIKPHQILAINRAKEEKIISIQLILPDHFEKSLHQFVLKLFPIAAGLPFNCGILTDAFKRAFVKSIKPTILAKKYSELSEKAEEAQIEVFARNAKQNFLRSPAAKGKVVLGIDPEYEHRCKLAVVSAEGEVLETSSSFPHPKCSESKREATESITRIIKEHKCEVIALGNGKGHRDTEAFLSELIGAGVFAPVDVTYTIVDESGTLVHSRGAEAKVEFPEMNASLISAVSIARRLQDPLAEYVKVDPRSLAAGMHTYCLPRLKLTAKLDEVIMEAVSFVGVDANTAPQCLMRRVAGLSQTKAANIIAHRDENGPFLNREMLKNVKGIDAKTFEQCVGFIRVLPETSTNTSKTFKNFKFLKAKQEDEKDDSNFLDQTWIHPESYELAKKFIGACKVNPKDLGTQKFVSAVKAFASQGFGTLAEQLETDEETLDVIVKGLTMLKGEDIRVGNNVPFFRKTLRDINDLSVGEVLSGEVRNVTNFGAFVDIGVGRDGLIHVQELKGQVLMFSQKVDVKIQKIDNKNKRINLALMKAYQFSSIYY